MTREDIEMRTIVGVLARQSSIRAGMAADVAGAHPMAHAENLRLRAPQFFRESMEDAAAILAELEKLRLTSS